MATVTTNAGSIPRDADAGYVDSVYWVVYFSNKEALRKQ